MEYENAGPIERIEDPQYSDEQNSAPQDHAGLRGIVPPRNLHECDVLDEGIKDCVQDESVAAQPESSDSGKTADSDAGTAGKRILTPLRERIIYKSDKKLIRPVEHNYLPLIRAVFTNSAHATALVFGFYLWSIPSKRFVNYFGMSSAVCFYIATSRSFEYEAFPGFSGFESRQDLVDRLNGDDDIVKAAADGFKLWADHNDDGTKKITPLFPVSLGYNVWTKRFQEIAEKLNNRVERDSWKQQSFFGQNFLVREKKDSIFSYAAPAFMVLAVGMFVLFIRWNMEHFTTLPKSEGEKMEDLLTNPKEIRSETGRQFSGAIKNKDIARMSQLLAAERKKRKFIQEQEALRREQQKQQNTFDQQQQQQPSKPPGSKDTINSSPEFSFSDRMLEENEEVLDISDEDGNTKSPPEFENSVNSDDDTDTNTSDEEDKSDSDGDDTYTGSGGATVLSGDEMAKRKRKEKKKKKKQKKQKRKDEKLQEAKKKAAAARAKLQNVENQNSKMGIFAGKKKFFDDSTSSSSSSSDQDQVLVDNDIAHLPELTGAQKGTGKQGEEQYDELRY